MKVICSTCPRGCALDEGATGFCRARGNRGGKITALYYGMITSLALDPIEKKPLKRFLPGAYVLSAGGYGCNMDCPFCQNHEISRADKMREARFISPEQLAQTAVALKNRGCAGIALTYNEPSINFEYAVDAAIAAHNANLKTVLVTNGGAGASVWRALCDNYDAMNIDLKGFTAEFYRSLGGDFDAVKRNIVMAAANCHIEITTLIIPGMNDSDSNMINMSEWLASISNTIPLHITRFFPARNLTDRAPTPVKTIYRLKAIAEKSLKYVYTGNC